VKRLLLFVSVVLVPAIPAQAGDWSGYVAGEFLGFTEDPQFSSQYNSYLSVTAEPEYIHEWNDGSDMFTFTPYAMGDNHDYRRTHTDIRELSWIHAADDWELTAGVSKVFWGVTESVHLVDIINQTDQVVNEDGEDKLGQPMVNLSLIRNWGVVDMFVLPGFRERTFPSKKGRPRFGSVIDTGKVFYESGAEELHTDLAVRWSHYFGAVDIGIAHFHGTAREPRFIIQPAAINPATGAISEINPLYEIIDQTSIDMQAIYGSWLWKLEAVTRSGQGDRIYSYAGGYEYTFVGILESQLDIGVITEYLYDSRGDEINQKKALQGDAFFTTPFQRDLVLGARLTLNDAQSTELLVSVIVDLEGGGQSYNIEASRRIGNSWKLSLEARGVSNIPDDNNAASFKDDTRLRMELARYF
jgi:hypothetical protein